MIRNRQGLILAIFLLLISCGQNATNDQVTPTPFSSTRNPLRPPLSEPIPISLGNLAANPEFFEGATLQLSGEYQKLPVLSCREDPHPSPATWGIIGDGFLANATGHDAQLRSLLAKNQPITVEGRWLRYQGPVGCGKSAPVQEVWYLTVNKIISPHPLVRVPQPQAAGTVILTEIASVPDAAASAVPTETIPTTDQPTGSSTASPTVGSMNDTPTISVVTATPTIQSSPGPTSSTPSPFPTSLLTATPIISATETVTTTVTPGPSTTPGPTASSSPNPDNDFNDQGSIGFEDLRISTLENGVPDRWTLVIDDATTITVTVAPETGANLIISIFDNSGTMILDSHNQSGQGQVETVTDFSIETNGLYDIQIENQNGTETDYALMVLNDSSYSFIFQGSLTPSSPQSQTLQAEHDHFWFFNLLTGETFSLRVTPNNQADPYLELYDPDGRRLPAIDETGTGETELIEDYEALSDGIYSIRVGEYDYAQMSYQILLTK